MAAVDEISQAERRRVLANDRKVSTYRDAAQASIDDLCGGRYGAIGKPTVTGAAPISYPRLPSDAPSNQAAMIGDEPPLGIDVNAMEPVGEIHEREPKRKGWRRI
jgi:hypothetical protein